MKAFYFSLALLMTTQFALAAGAKSKDHQRGERFLKELNLSSEQMEKVKKIRMSNKDELKSRRTKYKESRKAFESAMKDPKENTKSLQEKFDSFQKDRDAFQRARFNMMLEMRSVLEPDQIEKFQKIKSKKWSKKKKNRRG